MSSQRSHSIWWVQIGHKIPYCFMKTSESVARECSKKKGSKRIRIRNSNNGNNFRKILKFHTTTKYPRVYSEHSTLNLKTKNWLTTRFGLRLPNNSVVNQFYSKFRHCIVNILLNIWSAIMKNSSNMHKFPDLTSGDN